MLTEVEGQGKVSQRRLEWGLEYRISVPSVSGSGFGVLLLLLYSLYILTLRLPTLKAGTGLEF